MKLDKGSVDTAKNKQGKVTNKEKVVVWIKQILMIWTWIMLGNILREQMLILDQKVLSVLL